MDELKFYHEYHFLLDGDSSLNHHIRVEERPNIPSAKRKWNEYSDVLSRSGTMRKPMDAFEEITFKMPCNFIDDPYHLNDTFRHIRNWLLSTTAERKFQESYDLNWYRKLQKVELSDLERTLYQIGQFDIEFTIDPYDYAISGDKWYSVEDVKFNHWYKCEPLWKITNNKSSKASCSITVNDKTFEVTDIDSGDSKFVDVERKLTYATDTSSYFLRGGRYGQEEWLMLQNGFNSISFSDGFDIIVMPRWRNV